MNNESQLTRWNSTGWISSFTLHSPVLDNGGTDTLPTLETGAGVSLELSVGRNTWYWWEVSFKGMPLGSKIISANRDLEKPGLIAAFVKKPLSSLPINTVTTLKNSLVLGHHYSRCGVPVQVEGNLRTLLCSKPHSWGLGYNPEGHTLVTN